MDFEAAIFDLDGTLLNSMDIWEEINAVFLAKRGLDVPDNYCAEICSRSFEEAAQYTIDLFHLNESIESIVKEWDIMAEYQYQHNVKLMPHTLDYILRLKTFNIKIAVATGLPKKLYKPCLKNNKVFDLFDVHCSTEEVDRGKKYSDIYWYVSEKLNISPKKCLVFEDVLAAVKSAKHTGMTVYGVYDKYSEKDEQLIKSIADGYLYDFSNAPLPIKGRNR